MSNCAVKGLSESRSLTLDPSAGVLIGPPSGHGNESALPKYRLSETNKAELPGLSNALFILIVFSFSDRLSFLRFTDCGKLSPSESRTTEITPVKMILLTEFSQQRPEIDLKILSADEIVFRIRRIIRDGDVFGPDSDAL